MNPYMKDRSLNRIYCELVTNCEVLKLFNKSRRLDYEVHRPSSISPIAEAIERKISSKFYRPTDRNCRSTSAENLAERLAVKQWLCGFRAGLPFRRRSPQTASLHSRRERWVSTVLLSDRARRV